MMPPTIAPGIDPNPPNTAAGNAFKPRKPIFVSMRDALGDKSTPLIAATMAAKIQTKAYTRFTGTPMSWAAIGSSDVACMAIPHRVLLKK